MSKLEEVRVGSGWMGTGWARLTAAWLGWLGHSSIAKLALAWGWGWHGLSWGYLAHASPVGHCVTVT